MKDQMYFLIMRIALLLFIGLPVMISCSNKTEPVKIIFDTDIAPDYDDVGALAMLHAFEYQGEADILATISSNAFKTTAPTLSVLNTYFNNPDIPIGVVKSGDPSYSCPRFWAEAIIKSYPHAIRSNEEALDAVGLYRKILSTNPDTSVTIVTVGYFTNLSNLLSSAPDAYSPLNGLELVRKKVKCLVSMAAGIDSTGNSGYEFNVMADIPASQKVFNEWPTAFIISGFEIGYSILTGMKLVNDSSIVNSPVKDAYSISMGLDNNRAGRYSWDQTAVFVAVRGIEPYFTSQKLNFIIKADGKDTIVEGSRITYLIAKHEPSYMSSILESLMMFQPKK